jgi:hypothetical protein
MCEVPDVEGVGVMNAAVLVVERVMLGAEWNGRLVNAAVTGWLPK